MDSVPRINWVTLGYKEAPGIHERFGVSKDTHLTMTALEAGLDQIKQAAQESGILEMIVRRPGIREREILQEAELDTLVGLVGDNWRTRGSSRTADGSAHPDMQINIMSSRVLDLVSGSRERWHLAGDQLIVDLDLSSANLPPGTKLDLGAARLMITDQPHTGCKKFVERFGADALRFISSPTGKILNLRGLNSKVIHGGKIRVGDTLRKVN